MNDVYCSSEPSNSAPECILTTLNIIVNISVHENLKHVYNLFKIPLIHNIVYCIFHEWSFDVSKVSVSVSQNRL